MPRTSLLLIEDDAQIVELLVASLRMEGYEVEAAGSGEAGLARLAAGGYGLVLLDVMLPGMNGFETLRRIRSGSTVPVIMLTARGEEVDRIVGLEIGADDYLPKPFHFRELTARIQAVLRRSAGPGVTPARPSGGVTLDAKARTVRRDGELVELTSAEFELLRMLIEAEGEAVSRELLCRQVLDREYTVLDRGIDNLVSSVRKKLGPTAEGRERIQTIRNLGYVFVAPDGTCGD